MTAAHLSIIEDDETLAGLLSANLRAHGYLVTVAPTAEVAQVMLAGTNRPDLILLDINLPGDTGWSVLRSEAFEAAGQPPVIVAAPWRSVQPAFASSASPVTCPNHSH